MDERNVYAWWVWQRVERLGSSVLSHIDMPDDPIEREHLLTKLAVLTAKAETHRAEAQAEALKGRHG